MQTGNENFRRQMELYKEDRQKRTIVVEGTSELLEPPNLVYLSFKTKVQHSTLQGSIKKCMSQISKIRAVAVKCGLPHGNITSDSIGTQAKKIEYGTYIAKKKNADDDSYEDNEEEVDGRVWNVIESKIVYVADAVVRVTLDVKVEDDEEGHQISELFSRVFYSITTMDLGQSSDDGSNKIVLHEAPRYELSDLTDIRNAARKDACSNAKQKATYILDALEDDTVKLGKPVSLTDVHCDIEDDAEDSFGGNLLGNPESYGNVVKIELQNDNNNEDKNNNKSDGGGVQGANDVNNREDYGMLGDTDSKKTTKRPRLDGSVEDVEELGDGEIAKIFVVPPIKVVACIKAVFEID